jgi:uncharacterized protein (TIGR02328 family)
MRLWHHKLIPVLPRQQLLGQHRELCALRGLSWGRKHSTVNYIFNHSWEYLFNFHQQVIQEMKTRGYKPNPIWTDFFYRGKRSKPLNPKWNFQTQRKINYPEHNQYYLISCCTNLLNKLKKAPAGKYEETEVYKFYNWLEENKLIKIF